MRLSNEKLNDAYIVKDGTHDSPRYVDDREAYPLLTSKNIKDGQIDLTDANYISKEDYDKINRRSKVDKGDLLLPMIGTIGNPAIISDEPRFAIKNVALFKENKKKNSIKYLFYYLNSQRVKNQFLSDSQGGTQKFVSLGYLRNLEIPLPRPEDQKRITDILDKADSIHKKRRETIRLADEFLRSTFLEMFGDPQIVKDGIVGSDYFKFSSGKFNPSKNLNDKYPYPTFGGNGITGYSQDYLIDYDTIVIGRVGAYCGSVHRTTGKSWITDNAIYIKEFKSKINLNFATYLFEFMNLNRFADYSGQPKITQAPLENLIYPDIEIRHQNKFGDIVERTKKLKQKYQQSLQDSENLFNSLMQRAFRGEL